MKSTAESTHRRGTAQQSLHSTTTFKRWLTPQSHYSLITTKLVNGKGTVSGQPAFCTPFKQSCWEGCASSQVPAVENVPNRMIDMTGHPWCPELCDNEVSPQISRGISLCLEECIKTVFQFLFWGALGCRAEVPHLTPQKHWTLQKFHWRKMLPIQDSVHLND